MFSTKGRSYFFLIFLFSLSALTSSCQDQGKGEAGSKPEDSIVKTQIPKTTVTTGAENLITGKLHLIRGKKIALVANQTTLVFGMVHLADTLKSLGIEILRIFTPEHGFRGDHDAGGLVKSTTDPKTGIPLISLYGNNKKPTAEQMDGLDMVLFDMQDVGARFYTYISTMTYVMESCADAGVQFMVLDRPNPNGWYVDGPVLLPGFTSFIGLHPGVPVVHGMTIGEYARMVNQEGWLTGKKKCTVETIGCSNYTHSMTWEETGLTWIPPSPNLPTEYSAHLYPMLCLFEGLFVSVGRGTDFPFEIFGAPWHEGFRYSWRKDSIAAVSEPSVVNLGGLEMEVSRFTPRSIPGKASDPVFLGEICWGAKFRNRVAGRNLFVAGLHLILNLVQETGNVGLDQPLFKSSFDLLSGSDELKKQMLAQENPELVYESWQPAVRAFKITRSKYLLYSDFE